MTSHLRTLRIIVAAMLLSLTPCALAQDNQAEGGAPAPAPPARVRRGLESPQDMLRTFLTAMADQDSPRAVECLDLSLVPDDSARHVADLLLDSLDRIELVAYYQHPSQAALRSPAYDGVNDYTFFPRGVEHEWIFEQVDPAGEIIIARDDAGAWRFSAETVAGIWELHDSLRSLPVLYGEGAGARNWTLWIENRLPDSLVEGKFIEVKYWQWIGLAAMILLGLAVDQIVRALLALISRRIIARRGGKASSETLGKTVRPFGLFAAALLWLWAVQFLGLPSVALKVLLPAVKLFAMLAGVMAAYRITDLIGEVIASKAALTLTKIDDLLVPLVRKTAKVFVTIIGLIYVADSFDIEILPLLTGLGIGSLAFAFAAKDTIENFFGSVAVITDRPFEVGDWVQIGDVEGTVEELGFRSTRVRTFYNSLVTVPNATLVRATVDNFGRRKYRRWTTHLNITYDTPPEKIDAFCEGIRELIRVHPYTRKDYYQVWLHHFAAHSLDILVYVFHEAPDWQTELRERHRLILDVIRLADQLGVEFAFPTQTLHLHQETEGVEHTPVEIPTTDPEGRAMRDGRLAVRKITEHAAWRREKPGPYKMQHGPIERGGDDETQIESRIGGDAG